MWWAYFKHEPDVGHHRSLRAMIGWGYGHYFVFAAVAAVGAGLQVAAETTHDATHLGPAVAASTVSVPVVVFLASVGIIHVRTRTVAIIAPIAVTAVLVLAAGLAATWIGVPPAILAMGIMVCGLVAVNVVTLTRA
jgi:low temperature requirement protein LtrA